MRAKVGPIVAGPGWVIDGGYRAKLGDLVIRNADLVVWLDLPLRVWLVRLLRRTTGRVLRREELWNGNRETLRNVIFSRESLLWYSLANFWRRRRLYPAELAQYKVVRLRTPKEVAQWLATFA